MEQYIRMSLPVDKREQALESLEILVRTLPGTMLLNERRMNMGNEGREQRTGC